MFPLTTLTTTTQEPLLFPETTIVVRSKGYVSPPRVLEPETVAHLARVAAAGGVNAVVNAVDDAFKFIKTRSLLTAPSPGPRVIACVDASFGVLINPVSGQVERLFSPLGAGSDAIKIEGVSGPIWRRLGFSDKPELQYTAAALSVPNVPAMLTGEYAHFVIGSVNKDINSNMMFSHSTSSAEASLVLSDGFYRATYIMDYQGYNIYIPYGDTPTYDGQTVRIIVRYKQDRTPLQLLASGNGKFSNIYSTGTQRPAYSYTRSLLLGARSNGYDMVYSIGDSKISSLWMLDREDPVMANDLDTFLKTQYFMPA